MFLNVESMNEHHADLRRTAERDRRHRAPRAVDHAPRHEPPRRAKRTVRSTAAAAVARVARVS